MLLMSNYYSYYLFINIQNLIINGRVMIMINFVIKIIIINILKRCDKESHILFIKNTDILLGLELNESIGGIIMNSYIDDKQLKSPPLIKYQIDTLTTLKINYNK